MNSNAAFRFDHKMNFDFHAPLLANANLEAALEQFVERELVRGLAEQDRAYFFKHALVQDTVHATLLKNETKRLHKLVAYALEDVNASRLDEYAAALAHHFGQAEEDSKTLDYSIRAGDNAARVFANGEALAHYVKAIQVTKRMPCSNEQLIHLYTRYGRILEVTGSYFEALSAYQELHELADARADRELELASLMLRAPLHSAPLPTFNAEVAKQLLLDALGTARELGDRVAEARVLWNLTLLSVHIMRPMDGVMYGELSLTLAESLNLQELRSYTLHDLFIPYRSAGQIERARTVLAQAQTLFRELDNLPMLAEHLGMSAQFAMYEGRFDASVEFATEGLKISRNVGNPFGIFFNEASLSNVYLEKGQVGKAFQVVQDQIDNLRRGNTPFNAVWVAAVLGLSCLQIGADALSREMETYARTLAQKPIPPLFRQGLAALLARMQVLRGNVEQAAEDMARETYSSSLGDALQPGAVHMPLAEAERALALGNYAHALDALKPQQEWAQVGEYRMLLPENLLEQGHAYIGLGEWDKAAEVLELGRTHAAAIGMRRMLWQIFAELRRVETARGNTAAAHDMLAQAREHLSFIIEQTPADLCDTFLQLPAVREVMA